MISDNERKEKFNHYALSLIGMAFLFLAGTQAVAFYLKFGQIGEFGSLLFYLAWAYLLIRTLFYYDVRGLFQLLILYLLVIVIFAASYWAFPLSRSYYISYSVNLRRVFLFFIPTMLIISRIRDFSKAISIWFPYACVGAAVILPYPFMSGRMGWDYQDYGLWLSPFVLIFFMRWRQKKKLAYLFLFLFHMVLVLFGGRQSLLIVVGFILVYTFYKMWFRNKMHAFLLLVFASVAFLVFLAIKDQIFAMIASFLNAFNIQTRTLDKLISGELLNTDSRKPIFDAAVSIISKRGREPAGLLGDRYYLHQIVSWAPHVHNIVYEILIDFGTFMGGTLIALLVLAMLRRLIHGFIEKRTAILLMIILSVPHLMISGSFVFDCSFYLMIGLLMNQHYGDGTDNSRISKKIKRDAIC